MSYGDVLKELARQVRGSTIRVLDAMPTEGLNWVPDGTSNHVLWHSGHALWVMDLMGVELLSGSSELPDGWAAIFGQDSRPNAISKWPSREEVRARLVAQLSRLQELFDTTPDAMLLPQRIRSAAEKPWAGSCMGCTMKPSTTARCTCSASCTRSQAGVSASTAGEPASTDQRETRPAVASLVADGGIRGRSGTATS